MTIKVTLNAPNYEWIRSGLQSYGQPLMISPTAVETFGNEGIALNPNRHRALQVRRARAGRKDDNRAQPGLLGPQGEARPGDLPSPWEDPATRINALRTGEIDMTNTPPWDDNSGPGR